MPPRYDAAAWCPWTEADELGACVRYVRMSGGLLGACDWAGRTIYIRRGITSAQKLCVAAHEVLHLRRGPLMCATERIRLREEEAIALEVALRLIPFDHLVDATRWSCHLGEQAEALGVDRFTVRTRLTHLTADEVRVLNQVHEEVC